MEDDRRIFNLYRLTLIEHFDIVEAYDGQKGLEMATTQSPDVIVLDIVMPVMDGFEVLKRLRDAPGTAKIPVILLTGKAPQKDLLVGYNRETDHYILKPFTGQELLDGVNQSLANSQDLEAHP